MSIIIRLQNLPWAANALDIRQYFSGLSIPEGGVHIVGGELGDAFIAFSTDEDARQAFIRSDGKIKGIQIKLMLSSRQEMQRVIEQARNQSMAAFMLPTAAPAQQVTMPLPAAVPPVLPAAVPEVRQQEIKDKERDNKDKERDRDVDRKKDKKRSRSRSRDRDRKDRDRSRDRKDRRRDRSRSRSRDRRDRRRRDRSRSRNRSRSRDRESRRRDRDSRDNRDRSPKRDDKPDISAQPFQRDANKPAVPVIWAAQPSPTALNIIPPVNDGPGILGSFPLAINAAKRAVVENLAANLPAQGLNGFQSPNNQLDTPRFIPPGNIDQGMDQRSRDTRDQRNMGRDQRALDPRDQRMMNLRGIDSRERDIDPRNQRSMDLRDQRGIDPRDRGLDIRDQRGMDPRDRGMDSRDQRDMDSRDRRNMDVREYQNMVGRDNHRGRESWPPMGMNMNQNGNKFSRSPDLFHNPDSFDRMGRERELNPRDLNPEPPVEIIEKSRNDSGRRNRFDDNNDAPINSCIAVEPFHGTYTELRRFFNNFPINYRGIKVINDEFGRRTGVCYVQFKDARIKQDAMRLSGQKINNKEVKIIHISDSQFNDAVDRYNPKLDADGYPIEEGKPFRNISKTFNNSSKNKSQEPEIKDFLCLKLEDLPTYVKEQDILHIFSQHPLISLHLNTRPRGGSVAYVKFSNKDVAKLALQEKSHHVIRGKQVTVKPCRDEEFDKINKEKDVVLEEPKPKLIDTDCVSISKLPLKTNDRDISDFFSDIGVLPTKIHLMSNNLGFTGQAYCEFETKEEASKALTKNDTTLGSETIMVLPIKRQEMEAILNNTLPHPGATGVLPPGTPLPIPPMNKKEEMPKLEEKSPSPKENLPPIDESMDEVMQNEPEEKKPFSDTPEEVPPMTGNSKPMPPSLMDSQPGFRHQPPMRSFNMRGEPDNGPFGPDGPYGHEGPYGPERSNFDHEGSNFGHEGSNFGRERPNFGRDGPNFGREGPNFGREGPNFGRDGPNFGREGPNFGHEGPNFGHDGPNFGHEGSNWPPGGGRGSRFGPRGGMRGGPPRYNRPIHPDDEEAPPGCTVYLDNIPYKAGTNEILDFFTGYNCTNNVSRRYNPNNTPSAEARVTFHNPDDAYRAVRDLNGKSIWNRSIYLKQV